jgi:hypothetical protein
MNDHKKGEGAATGDCEHGRRGIASGPTQTRAVSCDRVTPTQLSPSRPSICFIGSFVGRADFYRQIFRQLMLLDADGSRKISCLPVHPLASSASFLSLPTSTLGDAIDLLSKVSRQSSSYRDGFHSIDARSLSITDVSQFIAPPIPPMPLPISGVYGARTMAARLASLLSGVRATAVYTSIQEALTLRQAT